MAVPATNAPLKQGSFKDKDKPAEVRKSNMVAAKGIATLLLIACKQFMRISFVAVADAVRSSLGPKGMDKMVRVFTYLCVDCESASN